MQFTTTALVSGGYLVEGTDSTGAAGTTVLVSPSWDYVLQLREQKSAQLDFDTAVEEFFKPLTEAADAVVKKAANPWTVVEIGEKVEGKDVQRVSLDTEGVLLRILEETDGSSLRWVNGTLVAVR